jgi:arylsulfatase A-like enzyme
VEKLSSHRPASLLGIAALVASSCSGGGGSGPSASPHPTDNVLVIVADDLGVDMIAAWGVHPSFPPTPNLDRLIEDGVLFRRCYTQPICSPTRAALLTGRFGFRTGIGEPLQEWLPVHALQLSEVTIAEVLESGSEGEIATTAIGKWHVGSASTGDLDHPNLQGFDWFQGTMGNLFIGQSYFSHTKVTNGMRGGSTVYSTTEQVDDALARITSQPEPWFTYLSFNAAHKPFHVPPASLHTYTLSGDPDDTAYEHYCAAVQAIDTEIGRLLDTMPPEVLANTTIVFMGDNGSPNEAVVPPSVAAQSKGTLYEGGVHVPLIISGKRVLQPGVCDSLVLSVDLFNTVAELFGIDPEAEIGDGRPIDGISLVPYLSDPGRAPLREWAFSEKFGPNGYGPYESQGWMVRDERWKLIRRVGNPDLLYDMSGLHLEGANLLENPLTSEQQQAYDSLQATLAQVLSS